MVFGITCIIIVILIYVCIKRNVITLELLEYIVGIYFVSVDAGAQVASYFTLMWTPVRSL